MTHFFFLNSRSFSFSVVSVSQFCSRFQLPKIFTWLFNISSVFTPPRRHYCTIRKHLFRNGVPPFQILVDMPELVSIGI